MLKKFLKNKIDFMSNNDPPTFPDGFDIEIFKFKHLKRANFFAEKNMIRNMSHHLLKKLKI